MTEESGYLKTMIAQLGSLHYSHIHGFALVCRVNYDDEGVYCLLVFENGFQFLINAKKLPIGEITDPVIGFDQLREGQKYNMGNFTFRYTEQTFPALERVFIAVRKWSDLKHLEGRFHPTYSDHDHPFLADLKLEANQDKWPMGVNV